MHSIDYYGAANAMLCKIYKQQNNNSQLYTDKSRMSATLIPWVHINRKF